MKDLKQRAVLVQTFGKENLADLLIISAYFSD